MFAHHPRNIFIRKNRRGFLSFLAGILVVGGLFFYSHLAKAVPSYARQTEQSCVACHAGGQFPELTPYGRMFKLTGYTMGQQTNPIAMMMQADYAKMRNNSLADGGPITKDGLATINQVSLFLAGKVTNNVGLFSQFTYGPYAGTDANGNPNSKGLVNSDLFDLRYADSSSMSNNDLIWGLTVHNWIGVQDVWNSSGGPWSYPYVSRVFAVPDVLGTFIEGGQGSALAGTGVYTYLNKNLYLELTGYQTAKNAFSIMSMGYHANDSQGNNLLQYVNGVAPYARMAYTKEWGPHNVMLGVSYLDIKVYPFDGDYSGVSGATNTTTLFNVGTVHYKDRAIDGQYQYLLSPHTITAQFRLAHETSQDATGSSLPNLNTRRFKLGYIYQAKYGASFAYASSSLSDGTSDITKWTPEVFYMPSQNIRVGLQYNHFTKYSSPTFVGSSASNNDYSYMYIWLAY